MNNNKRGIEHLLTELPIAHIIGKIVRVQETGQTGKITGIASSLGPYNAKDTVSVRVGTKELRLGLNCVDLVSLELDPNWCPCESICECDGGC